MAVGDFVHLLGDGFFGAVPDAGDGGAAGGVAVGESRVSICIGVVIWELVIDCGSFLIN